MLEVILMTTPNAANDNPHVQYTDNTHEKFSEKEEQQKEQQQKEIDKGIPQKQK